MVFCTFCIWGGIASIGEGMGTDTGCGTEGLEFGSWVVLLVLFLMRWFRFRDLACSVFVFGIGGGVFWGTLPLIGSFGISGVLFWDMLLLVGSFLG